MAHLAAVPGRIRQEPAMVGFAIGLALSVAGEGGVERLLRKRHGLTSAVASGEFGGSSLRLLRIINVDH